jgi:hypothetical protein
MMQRLERTGDYVGTLSNHDLNLPCEWELRRACVGLNPHKILMSLKIGCSKI